VLVQSWQNYDYELNQVFFCEPGMQARKKRADGRVEVFSGFPDCSRRQGHMEVRYNLLIRRNK